MFASELPGLFTADGEQTHEVFGHHKRDANPRSGTAKRRAIPPFRFVRVFSTRTASRVTRTFCKK